MFQPFERLHAGRTAVEGTGIGLSLSKALAELMNGTLGFTSRLDVGSDFWIELPLAEPLRLAPADVVSSPDLAISASKQGALVLYIEDNRAHGDLVSAIKPLDVTSVVTAIDQAMRSA